VDKTAVVKPPPLGITMGDSGNEYDFQSTPTAPESASKPRTTAREVDEKAIAFLTELPWPPR
jgi:hypothetical protein